MLSGSDVKLNGEGRVYSSGRINTDMVYYIFITNIINLESMFVLIRLSLELPVKFEEFRFAFHSPTIDEGIAI